MMNPVDPEKAPGDCIARRTRSSYVVASRTPAASRPSFLPENSKSTADQSTATSSAKYRTMNMPKGSAKVHSVSAADSPEIPLVRRYSSVATKSNLAARQSLAITDHVARHLKKTTLAAVAEEHPGMAINKELPVSQVIRPVSLTGTAANKHSGAIPESVKLKKRELGNVVRSKSYPVAVNVRQNTTFQDRTSTLTTLMPLNGRTIQPPPFHRVTGTVSAPSSLGSFQSLQERGVNREITLQFYSDFGSPGQIEEVILVRFTKLYHRPADQEYHPSNLQIFVNDFDVTKLESVNHKAMAKGPKMFSPIELPKEKLVPINKLQICWTVDNTEVPIEEFVLFLEKAERRPTATVLEDVSTSRLLLPFGVRRAFDLLSANDDGISMNSSAVSLLCPLSRSRPKLPVRGKNCRHLECFDASAYFSLNSGTKAKWMCPVCSQCVSVRDLIVDEFIMDLIQFTQQDRLNVSVGDKELVVCEINKPKLPTVVTVSDLSFGDASIIFLD